MTLRFCSFLCFFDNFRLILMFTCKLLLDCSIIFSFEGSNDSLSCIYSPCYSVTHFYIGLAAFFFFFYCEQFFSRGCLLLKPVSWVVELSLWSHSCGMILYWPLPRIYEFYCFEQSVLLVSHVGIPIPGEYKPLIHDTDLVLFLPKYRWFFFNLIHCTWSTSL